MASLGLTALAILLGSFGNRAPSTEGASGKRADRGVVVDVGVEVLEVVEVESPLNMIGLELVQDETVVCLPKALHLLNH
jgi:hypothetical protein